MPFPSVACECGASEDPSLSEGKGLCLRGLGWIGVVPVVLSYSVASVTVTIVVVSCSILVLMAFLRLSSVLRATVPSSWSCLSYVCLCVAVIVFWRLCVTICLRLGGVGMSLDRVL